MGYNSSLYANGGPFNPVGASQVYFPDTTESPTPEATATGENAPMSPVTATPVTARGIMGKPASWWLMLVIVFAALVFVSRRFGGSEKFGNIKLTVWNGILATLFYVIVLNFLKVSFSYVKVPGLSELVAAA